ncbi:unnamed protein product [Nyctereutes procyonoides]|uniref:(raccoon dog) hypothetical protein n=1 Tax=Nyctereutes procyonoides TaxID=34880 RepID=A0A811YA70_NYCPR|nr:unnamed protein product [Nyctereutes procyonoides]
MSWYELVSGARATPDAAYSQKVRGSPGNEGLGAAACLPPSPQAPCLSSPSTAPAPLLGPSPGHPGGRPRPFPSSGVAGLSAAPGSSGRPDGGARHLPIFTQPVKARISTLSTPMCAAVGQAPLPAAHSCHPRSQDGAREPPSSAPGWGPGLGQASRSSDPTGGSRPEAVEGVEGVAADRAPGRCAREQPGRARPGSGTGCPPRKPRPILQTKQGPVGLPRQGVPSPYRRPPVSLPVPPDGFQGSVVRLSSLGEPRFLQDGATSASGARGCEATSARARVPNPAPPRRSEGNRGTEGVESGCLRPCWLVPVPGPPARDFLS